MVQFLDLKHFIIAILISTGLSSQYQHCELAVVGAGIGGVYSAWRLALGTESVPAENICIFEAKGRPGGRILSIDDPAPGFDGYTVDLGAYRFHRSTHHHMRQLTEIALEIDTVCYTDSLQQKDSNCGKEARNIIAARGRVFNISDGQNADDRFSRYTDRIPYNIPQKYWWGPDRSVSKPRDPYDFLLGPNSIIKELGERWDELSSETDYATAMRIADEINAAMRQGEYRGIPYSEVSLLQASIKEGLTSEERALYFDTAWSVGENILTRMTLLRLGQVYARAMALLTEPIGVKAMVTPVQMRDGLRRRSGMRTMIDKMLKQSINTGVRVFYNTKVTSIRRAESMPLRIGFEDGGSVLVKKIIANIGKPDLIALGHESEPIKSSSISFRRSVERMFVYGLAKTYCFWEDAWWLSKLKLTFGRSRFASEELFSLRYHDSHVTCDNVTELSGCRGGLLTSYQVGDNSGGGSGIYVRSFNEMPYTPLTNSDNPRRLIPGQMSKVESLYFDDILAQIRRVHKSSIEAVGLEVKEAIPTPTGCIFADWRDVGLHTQIGPANGDLRSLERFTKPVPDLDISLVNEAWGQESGFAESSLNSAERALYHQYGLGKPEWMDEPFHTSVIKKFNQGNFIPSRMYMQADTVGATMPWGTCSDMAHTQTTHKQMSNLSSSRNTIEV